MKDVRYTFEQIVALVNPSKIQGTTDATIFKNIASLDKATEGDISFLGNLKYKAEVFSSKASLILVPNSYVTLLTDRKEPPKMPCIPQQAVFDLTGGSQGVWVLKDDMTVEQRVVDVREMSEGWSPVVSGLKLGEKVVISGHGKLGPGMKVKLAEPTMNDDLDPNYKPPVQE